MGNHERFSLRVGSVFAAAIAAGLLFGTASSSPVKPEDGTSYALTNFEITYPYDDPRSAVPPDPNLALVSYELDWEGISYPGEVPCIIEVRDPSGAVVGSLDFTQTSGISGVRGPGLQVPVMGIPADAEGWCGSPRNTEGAGYQFSAPAEMRVEPAIPGPRESHFEDRVAVTFDVTWTGNSAPGLRTCDSTLMYEDGTEESLSSFNISMADPHERMTLNVKTDRPHDLADVDVSCRPLQ